MEIDNSYPDEHHYCTAEKDRFRKIINEILTKEKIKVKKVALY